VTDAGAHGMPHLIYLVPAVFVALLVLEHAVPLRRWKSRLGSRLLVNAVVSSLAIAVAATLVRPVATTILGRVSESGWSLAGLVSADGTVQAILGFLLMDLSFYYWHRANHAWPFLWRFHNAHHMDPDLDVTTAVRFHFAEIVLSAAFRALQVAVIGGPAWVFGAYELTFQCSTLFQHSNLRLPIAVERALVVVVVTPRMHGIHHSKPFSETNSNWSSVCSWWDRLHGTMRLNVPQSAIDIGISGYSLPHDNTIAAVLTMPFRQQRDYWRGADDVPARPSAVGPTRLLE
jgi:sterol desaturase/sphingolipid hydroxylase (fatty acid hydroxylase superfamily)